MEHIGQMLNPTSTTSSTSATTASESTRSEPGARVFQMAYWAAIRNDDRAAAMDAVRDLREYRYGPANGTEYRCAECDGPGRVRAWDIPGQQMYRACPKCRGTGEVCRACSGTGMVASWYEGRESTAYTPCRRCASA